MDVDSIEIRTLFVNRKKLTAAMFNQLFYANIIDEGTGKLLGTPWGVVNRHTAWCRKRRLWHFHVVWVTEDGKLRHADETKIDVPRYTGNPTWMESWETIRALPQLFI